MAFVYLFYSVISQEAAFKVVELPSPEGANSFSHHVSNCTFAIFGGLQGHVRQGISL